MPGSLGRACRDTRLALCSAAMSEASEIRAQVVALVRERGYERREEAFQLSSGAWSNDYVDCRRALSGGDALEAASRAIVGLADELGIGWDAVGGLTMGADPLAHGIAVVTHKGWFSVRKEAKSHGTGRLIEGCTVGPGVRVLLVEDVVTSGASILRALDAVSGAGAEVVLACSLLDRGERAREAFSQRGVRYEPLATYRDLGIDPVAE